MPLRGLNSLALGSIGALHSIDETHLWVGTKTGLHKVEFKTNPNQATITESLLTDSSILDIEGDLPEKLWVATSNNGVFRFSQGEVTHYDSMAGLPDAAVHDLYITPGGNLWSVTTTGVYQYQDDHFSLLEGTTAFLNAPCYSMTETKDGRLWIATDSAGVSVYDGENWSSMDKRDGIAGNSVFKILSRQDGSLWLATSGGVSRYEPNHRKPSFTIEEVIFNSSLPQEEGGEAARTGSSVRFEFQSIDFKTTPSKRQYQARVVPAGGNDPPDIPFQTIRDVDYYEWTSKTPGPYRFEARAIDRDLNYSPVASFEFVVANPWYLKLAFFIPAGAAAATTLFAVVFLVLRLFAARREARELNTKLLVQEREKSSALSEANERIESQKEHLEQASQAKTIFLAHMSHEIRTPLHTVMGYASLLKKNPEIPDSQKASAEIIERSGKHLLMLVNEVLDLSKIEAGKAKYQEQEFYLWDCIQSLDAMFRLLGEQKGLEWHIDWECPHSLSKLTSRQRLKVRTDEQKLRQVLINLLNNAVKFTESGEIRLSIKISEPTKSSRSALETHADSLTVQFVVADTGVGIGHEERENVMKPFHRGRSGEIAGGTGLGLSIATRLVEILGGTLQLQSQSGKGSTFSFQLNLSTPSRELEAAPQQERTTQKRLVRMKTTRAVVADDNEVNRKLLAGILENLSIEVFCAADGLEAVSSVIDIAPNVVFLDIQMPNLDGIAACRQIREHGASLNSGEKPVLIAVSASAFQQDKIKCLAAGFNEFIPKPFNEDQIHSTLAYLLPHSCVFETNPTLETTSSLPKNLVEKLLEAAEIGSVRDIEQAIDESAASQDPLPGVLSEIQDRCRRFDFSGIQDLLKRLDPVDTNDESRQR